MQTRGSEFSLHGFILAASDPMRAMQFARTNSLITSYFSCCCCCVLVCLRWCNCSFGWRIVFVLIYTLGGRPAWVPLRLNNAHSLTEFICCCCCLTGERTNDKSSAKATKIAHWLIRKETREKQHGFVCKIATNCTQKSSLKGWKNTSKHLKWECFWFVYSKWKKLHEIRVN